MKKVLIPIDGSENSKQAFEWYLTRLHEKKNMVILVHFVDANNDRDLLEKEAGVIELQESYETKLLKQKIEYRWITGSIGSPGELIVRVAEEEKARFIVMATRGLGKIQKAFLGSVSDYVLSKASVPVIIYKEP